MSAVPTGADGSDDGDDDGDGDHDDEGLPPLPDNYWERPDVQLKLERLRELGLKARERATTRREKKLLAKFYTEEGLRRRIHLLLHPDIIYALETIWTAADADCSGRIEKDEYLVMHRKLVLALDPATAPQDAFEAAEEDWKKDAEGKKHMNKERFFWSWFELADLWTDTTAPKAYVDFLFGAMDMITRRTRDGVDWASDREVIKAHFKMRREEDNQHEVQIYDDGNHHPMVSARCSVLRAPCSVLQCFSAMGAGLRGRQPPPDDTCTSMHAAPAHAYVHTRAGPLSVAHLLTYLLTYARTHVRTYVLACLLTYLRTYLLTCLLTYLLTYLRAGPLSVAHADQEGHARAYRSAHRP